MLARHAEDLFWTGRYLERAEDTARMLDVTYHGLLEGGSSDAASAWHLLLEALHLAHPFHAGHESVTPRAVAEFLVADAGEPSSIISAIGRARDNARNVREHLSTELWEALNSCFLELRARDLQAELAAQPHELYREIRTRCQTIQGAGAETMPRSDPWRFLLLGRLIERAEMTCRMLRARSTRRAVRYGFHDFLLVLNSVSALEAYTREHGADIDPARVISFLLLAPDFPRSVLYCVRGTDTILAQLEAGAPSARPRRALGRIRAELEYQDPEELRAFGEHGVLDRAQAGIWEVAEGVEESFFAAGTQPQRHIFGVGVMELFEIRYLSLFRYPQPVWDSHNVLRAAPCSDDRQILLSYRLSIQPASRTVSYTDYFGTRVDLFGVARPHRELEVLAEIRVAMHGEPAAVLPAALGPRLEPAFVDAHHEYLVSSGHTDFAESIRREAREVIAGLPDDAAQLGSALSLHVGRTLQYAPGSTHVGIDVNELQRSRRGVCQDFAHYLIALCRSVGVPARYVSGYLFAVRGDDPTAPNRDEVFVQTHAWVEIAIPGAGWWPLDPTNRLTVGARHVKIGHGRDYDDVSPLRGLYHGPFQHELEVEVRMKRLATGGSWGQSQSQLGQTQLQTFNR